MPTTGRKVAALAVAFALAACARNSPPLPPDLSHLPPSQRLLAGDEDSREGKLSCAALKQEAAQTRAEIHWVESGVAANRGHNQAVVYASTFLPPVALAARSDDEAKKTLDDLQARSDWIDRLSKARNCATLAIDIGTSKGL